MASELGENFYAMYSRYIVDLPHMQIQLATKKCWGFFSCNLFQLERASKNMGTESGNDEWSGFHASEQILIGRKGERGGGRNGGNVGRPQKKNNVMRIHERTEVEANLGKKKKA